MKAVAMAFVLIAGAAIVLWYGNTLNSWVLGGLIGGLAALLLSIPIALTLFSFFSRHRNEQYQGEDAVFVQEEISLAQHGTYALPRANAIYELEDDDERLYEEEEFPGNYADEFDNAYDVEYAVSHVEGNSSRSRRTRWEDEEDSDVYRVPPECYLPAPSSSRSSTSAISRRSQQVPAVQSNSYDEPRQYSQGRRNSAASLSALRQTGYIRSSGYQVDPLRSRYRSEALRAARKEAAQQAAYDDEIDDTPPPTPRRYGARTGRAFPAYDEQDCLQESQRFSTSEAACRYPRQPRRVVDSLPRRRSRSTHPLAEDEAADDVSQGNLEANRTEENFRKPLVRRAPYTYEDDPVRQKMARHVERPTVRRSSRYLKQHYDDSTR